MVYVFSSQILRRVCVHHVTIVLQLFLGSCSIFFFWRVIVQIETGEELVGHLALRLLKLFNVSVLAVNNTKDSLPRLADHLIQIDSTLAGVCDFARFGAHDPVEARIVNKHEIISFFNQIHS